VNVRTSRSPSLSSIDNVERQSPKGHPSSRLNQIAYLNRLCDLSECIDPARRAGKRCEFFGPLPVDICHGIKHQVQRSASVGVLSALGSLNASRDVIGSRKN
jgi:hypothetical protein